MIDSSAIAHVDTQLLQLLKNKGDYVYHDPIDDRSLWSVLRDWLWGWLEENGINLEDWMEDILTIIGLGLLIYGTYLIVRRRSRIKRKKEIVPEGPSLQNYQEEWDVQYLTNNYQEAVDEQEWAMAIHWTYHLALVFLNDAQVIKRSAFKISSDYLQEIESARLRTIFQDLRLLHQQAWYDERECTRQDRVKADLLFASIKEEVTHDQ